MTHSKSGHSGSHEAATVHLLRGKSQNFEKSTGLHATDPVELSEARIPTTALEESQLSDAGTCLPEGTFGNAAQIQGQGPYGSSAQEGSQAATSVESGTASKLGVAHESGASTQSRRPLSPSESGYERVPLSAQRQGGLAASNAPEPTVKRPMKRRRINEPLNGKPSAPSPTETDRALQPEDPNGLLPSEKENFAQNSQIATHNFVPGNKANQSRRKTKNISRTLLGRSQQTSQELDLPPIDPAISTSNIINGQNTQSTLPIKGKKTLSRASSYLAAENAAADVVANAVQGSLNRRRKGPGRKRRKTPEGAEAAQIESSAVRMVDLCKDTHTGKRSLREKELKDIDEKAKTVRRQVQSGKDKDAREHPSPQSESSQHMRRTQDPGDASRSHDITGGSDRHKQSKRPRENRPVPALDKERDVSNNTPVSTHAQPATRIVNGEIVLDESSLRIDRHAHAVAGQIGEALEAVEESELTRQVTAGSWLKRDKSGSWTEELTELLYEGLRMFGTDFGMISKMFAGKSRHAIKRKFCLEERLSPTRIEATLRGERLEVGLEEFSQRTNTIYEDPKELELEMAEDRQKLEDEQAHEKEALEEAQRKRAEEAAAESAAVGGDSSLKENGGRKRRTRENVSFVEGKIGTSLRATRKPRVRPKK